MPPYRVKNRALLRKNVWVWHISDLSMSNLCTLIANKIIGRHDSDKWLWYMGNMY